MWRNPDQRLSRLNVFALMLGLNQLLYAPSLMLLAGHEAICAWPVALTAPFFALTPWLTRRYSLVARLWVPFFGIADSFLAQYVMGPASGGWFFILPSMTLAALLLERRERYALAALAALGMAVLVMPAGAQPLSPDMAAAVARINQGSAIMLTGFIGWLFCGRDTEIT